MKIHPQAKSTDKPTQTARRGLVNGALLLSLAALVAKVLSAVYRIPLQNLVGNTGFYVYQQVYPLYGIAMTFALSGLPVFISKLIAEVADPWRQQLVARRIFVILAGFGLCLFIGLFMGSYGIAAAMGDVGLTPLVQVVAGMALFLPFLAVGRGFAQGQFNMRPTAISQVLEQVVRVVVIIVVAWLAAHQHWNVYRMGAWAMSGALFGAIAALLVFGQTYRKLFRPSSAAEPVASGDHWRTLMGRLWQEGGTICLFAAVVILLQLVDSFTVKRGLVAGGLTDPAAKSLKGVYDRAQPLIQLGLVVATSFSATLLPALSVAWRQQRQQAIQTTLTMLIHISLALSAAATIGLVVLMPLINLVLFGSETGSLALAIYCISIIFASLISTYNSILQSMNQYRLSLVALIAGLIVKGCFNYWAVFVWGINGASWLTVISLATMMLILWLGSPTSMRLALTQGSFVRKLAGIAGAMGGLAGLTSWLCQSWLPLTRGSAILMVAICVTLGISVFVGLALWGQLFSMREWLTLPGGRRLLKLTKRN